MKLTGINTDIITNVIETIAPPNSLMASIDAVTARFISLVELGMDPLDDDYRIIDHNRNGKHHSTQCQQVRY